MKMRKRRRKLDARIRGYEAVQAKQTKEESGFHKPGSYNK
jgi:hypothetical protein